MSHHQSCIAQPDLFVRSPRELTAEVRRHGGGTPPRFIAPEAEPGEDEGPAYSPVRFAEEVRANERPAPRTVTLRVIDVGDFHKLTQ